jgi:hypothetical protein
MTKKIVVFPTFIGLFVLMSTLFAISVEPVKASEQITIVNHQGFLDSTGYYVVYGEVMNTGVTSAKNVYVKISYTSDSGVEEEEAAIVLNVLLPGRKAPFYLTADQQGSLVKSYTVELMDLTMQSEDLPEALEVVSSNSEFNNVDNVMITGTLKNLGAETAIYTRVYATVYDGPSGTGNVVAFTSSVAEPYNLDPEQTGTFQMGFYTTPGKSYTSYIVTAESAQYSATAEYTAAIELTSTATTSPTSLTSTPSPTNLEPSPTIPEAPPSIAMVLVIVVMLIVSVAVKKKSFKLSRVSEYCHNYEPKFQE